MNIEVENIIIQVCSEGSGSGSDSDAYKCDCGKQYANRSGLHKHKSKCKKLTVIDKLDEKDEEIATLKSLVAQYDARLKKLGVKHAALMESHAEQIRQLNQKVELQIPILPQVIAEPIPVAVKKLKPEDFLIERCANAINCAKFIESFTVEEGDFTHEKFLQGGAQWLFNLIERNLKGIGPSERPFHVIMNTNTHKASLYLKIDNEWVQCDDVGVQNYMRTFLSPILRKMMALEKEERRIRLIFDQQSYYPEKDDDGDVLVKDWDKHSINSELLEDFLQYKTIVLSNSSRSKDFLKLMKDKFTLS